MTKTLIQSILISLSVLILISCEKNNDPPRTENFRLEGYHSDSPGVELTITLDGNELTFRLVDDMYIFQEDIVFTRQQLENSGGLKGAGLTTMDKYWEFRKKVITRINAIDFTLIIRI